MTTTPMSKNASPHARPVLFSGDMVNAILDGRKTQTRRTAGIEIINNFPDDWKLSGFGLRDGRSVAEFMRSTGEVRDVVSKLGIVGDTLWVREAFMRYECRHNPWPDLPSTRSPDGQGFAFYRAEFYRSPPSRWTPSIHMPRWASRLTLRIVNVRVERLNSITADDAAAEGFPPAEARLPREWFAVLWESINGSGSWTHNPWVWVYAFEVVR